MKHATVLIGCCAALMACSDSGPSGFTGSVTFTYTKTGSAAVNYDATGTFPLDIFSGPSADPWAAGFTSTGSNAVSLAASSPASASKWDLVTIIIPRTTVGQSTIDPDCTANTCSEVALTIGASADEATADLNCVLTSGSINISSISSTRGQGSFSGSGTCTDAQTTVTPFSITNGTFDVPMLNFSVDVTAGRRMKR